MKLKTLKDMELPLFADEICQTLVHRELRKEAINRVKQCKEQISTITTTSICGGFLRCLGCQRDIWFNNITEEELS